MSRELIARRDPFSTFSNFERYKMGRGGKGLDYNPHDEVAALLRGDQVSVPDPVKKLKPITQSRREREKANSTQPTTDAQQITIAEHAIEPEPDFSESQPEPIQEMNSDVVQSEVKQSIDMREIKRKARVLGMDWRDWMRRSRGTEVVPPEKLVKEFSDLRQDMEGLSTDDRDLALLEMYKSMDTNRPSERDNRQRAAFYDNLNRISILSRSVEPYILGFRIIPGFIKNNMIADPVYFLTAFELLSKYSPDQRRAFREFCRDFAVNSPEPTIHVVTAVSKWIEQKTDTNL